MKAFYYPSKTNWKKSGTWFFRWKTAEDNNSKLNVFPNIPCTFLPFKTSEFSQFFSPRNLLFRQVLRKSGFLNSKMLDISLSVYFFTKEHSLKTSNKGAHVPLFINQFFFFNLTKDVTIDKVLNSCVNIK